MLFTVVYICIRFLYGANIFTVSKFAEFCEWRVCSRLLLSSKRKAAKLCEPAGHHFALQETPHVFLLMAKQQLCFNPSFEDGQGLCVINRCTVSPHNLLVVVAFVLLCVELFLHKTRTNLLPSFLWSGWYFPMYAVPLVQFLYVCVFVATFCCVLLKVGHVM